MGGSDIAGATGVVRIGAGEIAAASCLPGFVAVLNRDLPRVSLDVEIALTADLIQQLIAGRTDIVFAAGRIAHPMLRTAPIGHVGLLWLASPATVAAMREHPADAPDPDRKSVVSGQSVSGRVDLGGRR